MVVLRFCLPYPKLAQQKLLRTSKRGFFDRFWQRWAQSYEHTTRTHLPKDAEKTALRLVRIILKRLPMYEVR